MPSEYLIRPSRVEAWLFAASSMAGGVILLLHLELDLYTISVVLLVWLLGLQNYWRLTRAPDLQLQLFPARGQLALEARGQTQIYDKYKVYPARWFAILKLIDTGNNRTLLLNPARFESDSDWRGFRRELSRMEDRRAD